MIKNTVLFGLLLILTGGLYSCLTKKQIKEEIPVDLCSFDISFLDNTFASLQLSENDTVAAKAFGMRLGLNYVYEGNICKINPLETFSFFSSCYAGGSVKATKIYVPVNAIDTVYILADNDFDADHPAGSNITEFFSVFRKYQFSDVDQYLRGKRRLEFQQEYTFPMREEADVLLMKIPELPGDFQFIIRFVMANGEVMERTTPLIHLSL